MTISLPEFEQLLFPTGAAPDDDAGDAMLRIVLDVLVARFGHDHIVALLAELGDLEHAASQHDDET